LYTTSTITEASSIEQGAVAPAEATLLNIVFTLIMFTYLVVVLVVNETYIALYTLMVARGRLRVH